MFFFFFFGSGIIIVVVGQLFELKFFDNFVKQLYYMASIWSNISLESPVCTKKEG